MKLPTAQELQIRIAKIEGEKASAAMRAHAHAEAEKQAFLDRISAPSGLTDEQVIEKTSHIIERAVAAGRTSVQVFRFPNHLCTDDGRAVAEAELGWEDTLTGIPKEIYSFWERQLKPQGYHLRCEIVDFPGGLRGDVGMTLSWG